MSKKVLFRKEANLISKILFAIRCSQTLNGTTVILGKTNQDKKNLVEHHLSEAIKLLNEIQ